MMSASGDIARAKKYLKTLSEDSKEEIEFKKAQTIYLDYLSDRNIYKLNKEDAILLQSLSKSENEYAGFARSIYFTLTGKRLYNKHSHMNDVETRSASVYKNERHEDVMNEEEVIIYPNPLLSESFNIRIKTSNTHDKDLNYRIEVIDIYGKMIHNQKGNIGENEIKLIAKGLYIILVKANDKIIHTEKLTKL
jgi:hypothetical protein